MEKKSKTINLAILSTLLGLGVSEAAVTLTFAEVGSNVTATWSGVFDIPSFDRTDNASNSAVAGSGSSYGLSGGIYNISSFAGTGIPFPLFQPKFGTYSGETFGFNGVFINYPATVSPGLYSPMGTMTFTNTTLTEMGAAGFNQTLAWSGFGNTAGSQEIYFHTVPEPSSALFVVLGAFGVMRRKRTEAML